MILEKNKSNGMYIIREDEDRERAYVKSEEMRISETDEGSILEGYAAVFNSYSQDLGGFREKINPGAFAKTLNDGADVRALFNHDSNLILGRTKSKTLELSEDDKGLYYRVKLPDTSYAKDLIVSLKRKDITQNSFGFRVVSDTWSTDGKKRALNEVKLFDVSPVTYPAYPDATAAKRSLEAFKSSKEQEKDTSKADKLKLNKRFIDSLQ